MSAPATQSMFSSASDGARMISDLTLVLVAGSAVLYVLVMVLLLRATWSSGRPVDARRWLVGGGLLLPVVVLGALLTGSVRVGSNLTHDARTSGLEIQVIARRWWWELRYRSPDGTSQLVLANELHLPLDCAVVLSFTSHDVIHSFWVPALAGKVDVIPGRPTRLAIHATQPGRYRGQCAEYCGTQHANMGLEVVVETPAQFHAWLLHQARPATQPAAAAARRGMEVFFRRGCDSCHAIRGTQATGVLGPDLTHVAGRRLLAGASIGNDLQSRMAWIRSAQHIKPGSLMPSLAAGVGEAELHDLAEYLGSLD